MKVLYFGARALASASPGLRSCRGSRPILKHHFQSIPHTQPWQPQCLLRVRSLTTIVTRPSPPSTTPNSKPNSPSQTNDSPDLPTQIRLLMRRVPHPVAIITSTDPSPSTTQPHTSSTDAYQTSHFRGMTVSSFNTVTLTPEPVVSFNVRRPSETLNALLSSGRFLVHLLAPNPATAALARDFARGNQRLASAGASGDGEGMSGFQFVGVRPFHGSGGPGQEGEGEGASASVRSLPLPLPMLRERNDASAEKPGAEAEAESSFFPFIFECRLLRESVTEVYDHTIVVGTIVRAITSGDFAGEITSKDLCLTYANTKFYGVGDEVA